MIGNTLDCTSALLQLQENSETAESPTREAGRRCILGSQCECGRRRWSGTGKSEERLISSKSGTQRMKEVRAPLLRQCRTHHCCSIAIDSLERALHLNIYLSSAASPCPSPCTLINRSSALLSALSLGSHIVHCGRPDVKSHSGTPYRLLLRPGHLHLPHYTTCSFSSRFGARYLLVLGFGALFRLGVELSPSPRRRRWVLLE